MKKLIPLLFLVLFLAGCGKAEVTLDCFFIEEDLFETWGYDKCLKHYIHSPSGSCNDKICTMDYIFKKELGL